MGLIKMKTYEELLSDIEDDMELMGASHIVKRSPGKSPTENTV